MYFGRDPWSSGYGEATHVLKVVGSNPSTIWTFFHIKYRPGMAHLKQDMHLVGIIPLDTLFV